MKYKNATAHIFVW